MVKMTSAYANKLLKQLNEDKEYWLNKERNSCLYTVAVGETPVVPEYDYAEVAATIEELDRKICIIKHAINQANVLGSVEMDGKQLSIDTILVRMAQLNKRKGMLDFMRKQSPKSRKEQHGYGARLVTPEYQYIKWIVG